MSHLYRAPIKSHLLTKEHDSLILGKGNNVNQHISKEAINALQSVAWELNVDILDDLRDVLKDSDEALSTYELQDRVKAFNLRDVETDNVIQYLLDNGNTFFFGWKYDKRGRSYSQGYHVNPQGNEYRKAMLQFSNKKMLTDAGRKHLLHDIANTFGYDKLTWLQRRIKANQIVADIFSDTLTYKDRLEDYIAEAGDKMLFRKAINAYYNGVILELPIGHNMGYDGTASGLQFMSAMSGCAITARNCNVHPKRVRTMSSDAQTRIEQLEKELAEME